VTRITVDPQGATHPEAGMASTTRSSGARLPRGERREQILAVAAKAFSDGGYRGTSLAEIAAQVGVSQPGLLHHYPTKDALILAVLEHRDELDQQALADQFPQGAAGLAEYWMAVCRRNLGQRDLVRLFMVTATEALDHTHPGHAFYRRRFERNRELLAARVRADQAAGRLPDTLDPAITACELIALTNGVQLQWLMYPEIDMCGIVQAYLDRLAHRPAR
jgi:AcrR family transcriptional regulator